jgi:hypothetical protein
MMGVRFTIISKLGAKNAVHSWWKIAASTFGKIPLEALAMVPGFVPPEDTYAKHVNAELSSN